MLLLILEAKLLLGMNPEEVALLANLKIAKVARRQEVVWKHGLASCQDFYNLRFAIGI